MMLATLVADREDPTVFRVEAVDEDGGCEVALFSGPNALERAIAFAAGAMYYADWVDPEGRALAWRPAP